MTRQRFKSILFDYGGVFTNGSRAVSVSTRLARTKEEQSALADFFRSEFVRQCARGEHDSLTLIDGINKVVSALSPSEIFKALAESCVADNNMLKLVRALKSRYDIYLLSDSLPPYTEFIATHYRGYFDVLFMSDTFGRRKSEGLYQYAKKQIPELYESTIYIDDRKKNLAALSEKGVIGIVFVSHYQCINELKELGVEVRT